MKLSDFHFSLPDELIAHYPPARRTDSRLLHMDRSTGELEHSQFNRLTESLNSKDLLVFNNTRVIAARLFGQKESGGKVEVLIERVMADNQVMAQIRASKSPKPGSRIFFQDSSAGETTDIALSADVLGRNGGFFHLQFPSQQPVLEVIDRIGHMPLPPYIKRKDEALDQERYQTVYGEKKGAVAAPTAGLHFDKEMLVKIEQLGIDTAFVTLHVGAGTFQPVRTETIAEHEMHAEYLEVSESVCAKVKACRQRGGRVIAVGTTSVRCLETASRSGEISPYKGDTNIFIFPGYEFVSVDALLTNFHLPESTLIMLVSALAGRDNTMKAYAEAVKEKYRFFSYGDAMFIS